MKEFAGKRVLITGGTSGIGLALADAFRAAGARVAVCARSEEPLAAFAAARPDAIAIKADITDLGALDRLLDEVAASFGGLDILINNAGRLVEHDFRTAPPDPSEIADDFALNLLAPVALTTVALARHAPLDAIVFISSGYALVSPTRAPTYGAAKAGLHGFAGGLRRQLEPDGTHVLEVLPPAVETPATAHRRVRKVSAEAVASVTLQSLERKKPVALIGAARMLPTMLRLFPSAVSRAVSNT